MEKKDIRVLALDLDGTLTNDQKVVTPATRAALDAAAAKGVTIVLASGRPTAGVMPLAKELGLDKKGGCILSYNGGAIIDCATGETLYRKQLDAKYVPQLCAFAGSRAWSSLPIISRASSPKAPEDKWALKEPDIAELRRLFRDWQEGMQAGGGWNALFWDNHDQPRAVTRFGGREGVGERGSSWDRVGKMLAVLSFTMQGTPYIYQGDELGMANAGYASIDAYADVESVNAYRLLVEGGASADEALRIGRGSARATTAAHPCSGPAAMRRASPTASPGWRCPRPPGR